MHKLNIEPTVDLLNREDCEKCLRYIQDEVVFCDKPDIPINFTLGCIFGMSYYLQSIMYNIPYDDFVELFNHVINLAYTNGVVSRCKLLAFGISPQRHLGWID